MKNEYKILIIEDDLLLNDMTKRLLTQHGYCATSAYSGSEALLLIERSSFDLILLDLMLPGISGEIVLEKIKNIIDIPIIGVSAKTDIDSKVNLIRNGADDYITKPFEIKEVVARVAVQLRHAVADVPSKSGKAGENQTKAENDTGQGDTTNTYIAGPVKIEHRQLVLDRISRQLYVADNAVDGITKQEFAILELLMAHPRQVFAKEDIFEYAWDEPYIGETKTLDVHISNIRKKIKKLTDDEYVETVWGIGYKMKE